MSDTDPTRSVAAHAEPLNNFAHRNGSSPALSEPSDLITEPTPAQKERLIYLVDDALDTLESNLNFGKAEIRQKAADSVLDRAGIVKVNKQAEDNTLNISADAIVKVVQGLAQVFGSASAPPTDVTPPAHEVPTKPPSSLSSFPSSPSSPPEQALPADDAQEQEQTVKHHETNAKRAGLPASLLNSYTKDSE